MARKDNVVQISVKRKFNLGNYESMDIEMVAVVGDNQVAEEVITQVDERIITIAARRKKMLP